MRRRAGTRVAAAAVSLVVALGAAACAKKDADRAAARDRGAGGPESPAPAAATGDTRNAAQQPREHVLAEKVVAAIAADDYRQLAALTSKRAAAELGELNEDGFRKLRERLAAEKIDLTKATISRVEATHGGTLELVDVFLAYNGKMFQLHFTAMESSGRYGLVAIATWVRWV